MSEEENEDVRNVYLMSEKYDCSPIDGQHPISKDDLDIIHLVVKLLENTGHNDDLASIMSAWKTLATDTQIKEDLQDFMAKGVKGDGDYKNKVFKDNVYNPGHAFCFISCRRIRNHFHLIHQACLQLLQSRAPFKADKS